MDINLTHATPFDTTVVYKELSEIPNSPKSYGVNILGRDTGGGNVDDKGLDTETVANEIVGAIDDANSEEKSALDEDSWSLLKKIKDHSSSSSPTVIENNTPTHIYTVLEVTNR